MVKILIIGGVAGGATAAARLRRMDEQAEIILFEKDEHISFANCGLPYHIGGVIARRDALLLQTPERFQARFHVDVRVRSEVIAINPAGKTVTVRSQETGEVYEESYDKLILSPGSRPIGSHAAGADAAGVFTLRNLADTDRIMDYMHQRQPKRAVVVGGGYIGLEMAENLMEAGLAVELIQRSNQVMNPLDYDMACDVHHYMHRKGLGLHLNSEVTAIAPQDEGLRLTLTQGELATDMVIFAIGVEPDSRLAAMAGLDCNEKGGIVVDRFMRTSNVDIYAVGDAVVVRDFVTGQPALIPLAGPANKQVRIVADHICGADVSYAGTQGSSILKIFDLVIATTGINEKTAKRQGLDYDKVFAWLAGHASYYPGTQSMSMKVLFEKGSGKILGAQIVGFDGVDKRCDLLAMAVRLGLTAADLTQLELCYAPPFGSAKDPVNVAGYMIENVRGELVRQFHWHDVAGLPQDGSVTLLDVRTGGERQAGSIAGFAHIPVDELRKRIGELPEGKPVFVHCQSGVRSYLACRILAQKGYECYNLAGGYRLYESVTKA